LVHACERACESGSDWAACASVRVSWALIGGPGADGGDHVPRGAAGGVHPRHVLWAEDTHHAHSGAQHSAGSSCGPGPGPGPFAGVPGEALGLGV